VDRDLDLASFAERHPDLFRLYRSAVARGSAPYLDARLDLSRFSDRTRDRR
jgi:hypothetical protein